jgi:ketosteroid isomerase-like protein
MNLFPLLLGALMSQAAASGGADEAAALRAEVEAADKAFFAAVFDSCDLKTIEAMTTDDFEFFHDKWGQIAKSKQEFVTLIQGGCERQRQGTDFKARRELSASSLVVYPMKSFGALEIGEHSFFKVGSDGSLTPTEYAKFTQLWRREEGKLKLARVLSYAHTDGPSPGGRK